MDEKCGICIGLRYYGAMSEEQLKQIVRNTPRPVDRPTETESEDSWCRAFVEGTSRFPQGFFGNSTYLAAALLDCETPDLRKSAYSKLSPAQMMHVAALAEGQHRKRSIEIKVHAPARDTENPHRPNVDSINHIWNIGMITAQGRIDKFAQILAERSAPSSPLYGRARLDSGLLQELRRALRACTDALDSSEGVALSREYKTLIVQMNAGYEKRELIQKMDELKLRVQNQVFQGLLKVFPEDGSPGIARALSEVRFPNDWK